MALVPWGGAIVDESEQGYLIQWEQHLQLGSASAALQSSWVPKLLVQPEKIQLWTSSITYRMRRRAGHFPWEGAIESHDLHHQPVASTSKAAIAIATSSTNHPFRNLLSPIKSPRPDYPLKREASSPHTSGGRQTPPSPKRIRIASDQEAATAHDSVVLRLAMDSCVNRIHQALASFREKYEEGVKRARERHVKQGGRLEEFMVSYQDLANTCPVLKQARGPAEELASLVARAKEEGFGADSDFEYGQSLLSDVSKRAHILDIILGQKLDLSLYPPQQSKENT